MAVIKLCNLINSVHAQIEYASSYVIEIPQMRYYNVSWEMLMLNESVPADKICKWNYLIDKRFTLDETLQSI